MSTAAQLPQELLKAVRQALPRSQHRAVAALSLDLLSAWLDLRCVPLCPMRTVRLADTSPATALRSSSIRVCSRSRRRERSRMLSRCVSSRSLSSRTPG